MSITGIFKSIAQFFFQPELDISTMTMQELHEEAYHHLEFGDASIFIEEIERRLRLAGG